MDPKLCMPVVSLVSEAYRSLAQLRATERSDQMET